MSAENSQFGSYIYNHLSMFPAHCPMSRVEIMSITFWGLALSQSANKKQEKRGNTYTVTVL
jgi:hypothetical protein